MSQVDSVCVCECLSIERRELSVCAFSAFLEKRWQSGPLGSAVHWACYGAVTVRVAAYNAMAPLLDVGQDVFGV